jgi:heptosyltransferase-2
MLRKLALASATQPLSRPVPGESAASHLAAVGPVKAARRAALRQGVLWLTGQRKFKHDRFPAAARKVLWCYFGESQLGDALMDLAPRSLLLELGFEVDLFTIPALAAVFQGDPWLRRVGSQASDFIGAQYQCAIVLSNKRRPLQPKMRSFPRLPWVSVHENFTGPNFHRGLFAAQRLADLAGQALSPTKIDHHGRQKLGPIQPEHSPVEPGAIALAVGGVHDSRTYAHWETVMRVLLAAGRRRFVLVGSDNARTQAQALAQVLSGSAEVIDLTGRLTLPETRAVLDAAAVTVCPDGGLMHLALTTRSPIVPLFAARIAPEWRMPGDCTYTALRSVTDRVSDISPQEVAAMVMHSLSAQRQ